jgi:hypothetical protein
MAGENRIGIEFAQTGAKDVVAAAQQTSAAINQANQSTATTAKASGEAQVKSSEAVSGAMRQAMGMVTQYIGVLALLRMATDSVKDAMADELAAVRFRGTLENIGMGGGKAYDAMMTFAGSLRTVYGIADGLTVPALNRLMVATGNVEHAQYLAQLATRMSIQLEGVTFPQAIDALVAAEAGRGRGLIAMTAQSGIHLDKTKDLHDAYLQLEKTVGASSGAMDTNADRSRRLNTEFSELKKELFSGLMPAVNFGIGVFSALALIIKTSGSNLGLLLDFAKQIVPQLMVVMNPANWLQPQKMMEAYNLMEVYTKDYFRNMAESNRAFVTEWQHLQALAFGNGEAAGSTLGLPAGLGAGKGLNDAAGGAAGDTGAEFDRSAYADMVNQETAFAQLAADNQIEIARYKRERMVEITGGEVSMQTAIYQRGFLAYKAMVDKALSENKAFAAATGAVMGNTINGMTNLWSGYFEKIAAGEQVKTNMFAESGKLFLAMILDQVKQTLMAKAVEQATLAGAFFAGSFANPLLLPLALGHAAAAAALGVGAVAAGVGASMLTPQGAQSVTPVEVMNPSPGGGGGGSYGGYGSAPQGGQTISNSNVTIYYNPTMVVSGNVYGMDDFRKLVMGFFQQYAYVRGMDLGTVGG